jgi:hypothetical protein
MRKFIASTVLLLLLINGSIAQQSSFSASAFKPLHCLTGLWKMDTQRGTIYEEWQVKGDGQLNPQETATYRYWG